MTDEMKAYRKKLREAVAQYMASEGCACCEGDSHIDDAKELAELIGMSLHKDKSGVDWLKYRPKENQ